MFIQRLWDFLRAVSIFFLVCVTPVSASVDGKLELWFEYNGRQSGFDTIPAIECFSQDDKADTGCDLYQSEDGRYWIDRPLPGNYILHIRGKAQGADLYREYPFTVTVSTTGPLLIALNRTVRLRQPVGVDGNANVRASVCSKYDEYQVPVLTLLPNAEMTFAWHPLVDADAYQYKLWRVRCSDDLRIEPLLLGSSRQDTVQLPLPANDTGEYYALELIARHGPQEIGQLLLSDSTGRVHDTYPFVVTDLLGERNWYPYVITTFVLVFLIWLGLWLLRGVAMLRLGRGFVWGSVIVFVLGMGYLQRQSLIIWSEQGKQWLQATLSSQKWYRSPARDDGYTVDRKFAGGDWRGYLVARGQEPFVGSARRAEIGIHFSDETARVTILQGGRWQALQSDGFTIRRSGAGMTLFGHARKGRDSELWSISIADLRAPVLRLTLDRMISRRNGRDGGVVSERYQATGELHHILP